MADAAELLIGVEVTCNDGAVCGEVERVILDPVARTLTHLVVRARNHPRRLDSLVSIALAETEVGGTVRLNCSADDFAKLDAAEEKHTSESSLGYFHSVRWRCLYGRLDRNRRASSIRRSPLLRG